MPNTNNKTGNKTTIKTLLAFDFGTKRIGIASGQTITQTATALKTLHAVKNKPDWDKIAQLIQQWQPNALVVGLPLTLDGGEQAMTKAARRFARQLHGRFHLSVFEVDERFSSTDAEIRLQESGDHWEEDEIDGQAAVIILEMWFSQGD
ncbi:MAG: Holliday junction resolvase RuvX [Gammaproteobacteria bacterium]|nr:Holliday junction resolvase RuvX [Gammaproteobacteria bacterium]